MSIIEFPRDRTPLTHRQRDDIAAARGHAWTALMDYVERVDGMVTTASWMNPDRTPNHRVAVFGLRDRDFHQGVTVNSPSIVTSLMRCLHRLETEDWDKKDES